MEWEKIHNKSILKELKSIEDTCRILQTEENDKHWKELTVIKQIGQQAVLSQQNSRD